MPKKELQNHPFVLIGVPIIVALIGASATFINGSFQKKEGYVEGQKQANIDIEQRLLFEYDRGYSEGFLDGKKIGYPMYEKHPTVPDFGAICNYEILGEGYLDTIYKYLYTIDSMTINDDIEKYANGLKDCGFYSKWGDGIKNEYYYINSEKDVGVILIVGEDFVINVFPLSSIP